jgi:tetratricopeptide (TPR) repeat protein
LKQTREIRLALNLRGQAKAGLNDFYGAIGDYNFALEADSTYAEALNNRGEAKMALGDDEDALSDFDKAIKFNPKYSEAYSNRGLAKYNIEDLQGAYVDFFQKHLSLGPSMQTSISIVACKGRARRIRERN